MAWLLRDGDVLASCVAVSVGPFARIPIGIIEGAQVLPAQRLCFVGRGGADVAVLDRDRFVIALSSVRARRPVFTRSAGVTIVVAQHGAFSRWNLVAGDQLEIR
jgi:hypothetical protein